MIGVGSGALYATGLPEDYSIVVAGMLFRKRTILLTTGVSKFLKIKLKIKTLVFIAILIITDVGSSILWLIGVSVFGVLGHAALRKPAAAAIPATEFDEPL